MRQAFIAWARRVNLERNLAILLLIAGVSSGTATFVVMTGNLPIATNPTVVKWLLVADMVLLLGLSALIAIRLIVLWTERKRGMAGSRLHVRLVALFSLVAVTPTIIVALFSVLLFDFGLKRWFSEQVSTAIFNSLAVAQAYTEEHHQTIAADALAIAQVINRGGPTLVYNPGLFNRVVTQQAQQRSLTEVAVYDSSGRLLARASNFLLAFNPDLPDWALDRARSGELVIRTSDDEDRVRALVRLDVASDAFLYVGRLIDARVLGHLDRTRGAVRLYKELEGESESLQVAFEAIFAGGAMMLRLAAGWGGLAFATKLTGPIGNLIVAAEQVAAGDLSARVQGRKGSGEIGLLARAFNRMTGELESQQGELLQVNRQLDERSRFIEAVLGGVSAGVIGLDRDVRITLPNRSACELLKSSADELKGKELARVVPEMAGLLRAVRRRPNRLAEKNLSLQHSDGTQRTLLVRIAAELDGDGIIGYVVTFDDITELLSAQRKAAWSDIARRIAHEIKNPLTPIQLSAERLKRKYLSQVTSEPETFQICTDTIIRHVGDIGRMVDEFSSFARMPAPEMAAEDLRQLIKQAVFLQVQAHADIEYLQDLPDAALTVTCDRQQVGQALTNLLLNAAEAIAGREVKDDEKLEPGSIRVRLFSESGFPIIEIEDNGRGLPKAERHRLTEPYVTTRQRGTGLGLAIVKKIMEDHNGDLALQDREGGGALVRLVFAGDGGGRSDAGGETDGAAATAARKEESYGA